MNNAKKIAKEAGCSLAWVYKLANRLGRLPTVEEVKSRKGKIGRPPIYAQKNETEDTKSEVNQD